MTAPNPNPSSQKSAIARSRPGRPAKKAAKKATRPIAASYMLSQARKELPRLVKAVSSTGPVKIRVYDQEMAVLVSTAQWLKVQEKAAEQPATLAHIVALRALGSGAPRHLLDPQIQELSSLSAAALATVLLLQDDGVSPAVRTQLEAAHPSVPPLLRRLIRRKQIARTLEKAREEGLYDVVEHDRGSLDAWGEANAMKPSGG